MLNSASVDGKIAISPTDLLLYGDERWKAIEGSGGFNLFEWLKTIHKPQATLEGSGSFVLEGEVPDDPSRLFVALLREQGGAALQQLYRDVVG